MTVNEGEGGPCGKRVRVYDVKVLFSGLRSRKFHKCLYLQKVRYYVTGRWLVVHGIMTKSFDLEGINEPHVEQRETDFLNSR